MEKNYTHNADRVDEGDDDGFVLGVLLQLWLIWDIESVVEILV